LFDFLSLIISFFILGFLGIIVLIGIKFFHSLVTVGQSNDSYNEETDKSLTENSKEDSQGDGLVLFDDPLFPEEIDEDEV
jgi:hypothetical protein